MKRSSSASMITELLQMSAPLSNSDSSKHHNNRENGSGLFGKRNLSASNTSLPSDIPIGLSWASPIRRQPMSSPLPLMRINSPTSRQHRVEQLRKEESVDERIREAEQDREVTSQLHLNQSCIELKIDDDDDLRTDVSMETLPCPVTMTMLVTTPISSPVYSTRVRSRSLTPTSPSSSRTFTSYRRSLSPVPLRPSSLCFEPRKRKRNSELEEMDVSPTQVHPPAAKRAVFISPLTMSPPYTNVHSNPGPYTNVHGNPGPYTNVHGNPGPYTNVHSNPGPYTNMHSNPGPYTNVHSNPGPYTNVHSNPGPYTSVHSNPGPYTTDTYRPAFDTQHFNHALSTTPMLTHPLTNSSYGDPPDSQAYPKKLNIPGRLMLNSQHQLLNSAFLPFKSGAADGTEERGNDNSAVVDGFETMSTFPVTTIS